MAILIICALEAVMTVHIKAIGVAVNVKASRHWKACRRIDIGVWGLATGKGTAKVIVEP
jgi:hypothetical protein